MQSKILRLRQVIQVTGLSRSSIYSFQAQGNFPKSVKLGSRSIGWFQSDIDAWIESRKVGGEK